MTIGEKIHMLRTKLGMTLEELGDAVGVGKSTVLKWENGKIANMRRDKIAKLAEALQTSPGFLMGWKDSPEPVAPIAKNVFAPTWQQKPLLGDIACGEPILAEDNVEEYIHVLGSQKCDFCLRCKGDSMEPLLFDGDVVMIRMQPDVENGQIAAVLIDSAATLKHVYHLPDHAGVQLVSENAKYAPLIYTRDNCDSLRILGRAIAYERVIK